MASFNIAVIRGDGIGPEIVEASLKVLDKVGQVFSHQFIYIDVDMGGIAIDKYGEPLPKHELKKCLEADSVILGAVGGPKWDSEPNENRPEKGLLKLRKALDAFANLRPTTIPMCLKDGSPLKDKVIKDKVDIMVVRELVGGIYFGERGYNEQEQFAYDVEKYSTYEIERVAKVAFETAMVRRKKLISVDKANVLETSRLWRKTVDKLSKRYPEVEVSHMYVDNAAMQIVINPSQFDVIVTSNMFGDILSDLLAAVSGSIGLLASASLGSTKRGLYEPIHGSAPDIAGKNIANPIATIQSIAMMLELSFGLKKEAKAITNAINLVLEEGYRTQDIMSEGKIKVGTFEMGELVANKVV